MMRRRMRAAGEERGSLGPSLRRERAEVLGLHARASGAVDQLGAQARTLVDELVEVGEKACTLRTLHLASRSAARVAVQRRLAAAAPRAARRLPSPGLAS